MFVQPWRWIVPASTALLLLAILVTSGPIGGPVPGRDEYQARVRDAIEAIPYRIGPWIGSDAPPQPAAEQLLRPNKIMQRRYVNPLTDETVNLLIVHCGDVRDMLGHYPPVCYPAHGWMKEAVEESTIEISGLQYPARHYRFKRGTGGSHEMAVLNFFVLPEQAGMILSDMDSLRGASKRTWRSGLGSAQIQLLTSDHQLRDPERLREVAKEFMNAVEPAVRVIASGVDR